MVTSSEILTNELGNCPFSQNIELDLGNVLKTNTEYTIRVQLIRALVDALCGDEQGQISHDPRTKRLLTRRESLAKPSKHANNSAFARL